MKQSVNAQKLCTLRMTGEPGRGGVQNVNAAVPGVIGVTGKTGCSENATAFEEDASETRESAQTTHVHANGIRCCPGAEAAAGY